MIPFNSAWYKQNFRPSVEYSLAVNSCCGTVFGSFSFGICLYDGRRNVVSIMIQNLARLSLSGFWSSQWICSYRLMFHRYFELTFLCCFLCACVLLLSTLILSTNAIGINFFDWLCFIDRIPHSSWLVKVFSFFTINASCIR